MLQTVGNALDILNLFTPSRPAWTAKEIGFELGLDKANVHRLLKTLVAKGFLERDSRTSPYRASFAALKIARSPGIVNGLGLVVPPFVTKLVARVGETSFCCVPAGRYCIDLDVYLAPGRVMPAGYAIGKPDLLHTSAAGKAILAFRSPAEIDDYIDGGLPQMTAATITEPDQLRAALAQVRERGFATNLGEWNENIRSVAAPLRDASGRVIAALGTIGPTLWDEAGIERAARITRKIAGEASEVLAGYRWR